MTGFGRRLSRAWRAFLAEPDEIGDASNLGQASDGGVVGVVGVGGVGSVVGGVGVGGVASVGSAVGVVGSGALGRSIDVGGGDALEHGTVSLLASTSVSPVGMDNAVPEASRGSAQPAASVDAFARTPARLNIEMNEQHDNASVSASGFVLSRAQREAWQRAQANNEAAARPLPLTQLANQLANDVTHVLYDVPYSALRALTPARRQPSREPSGIAASASASASGSGYSSAEVAGSAAARPAQRLLTQAQIDLLGRLFAGIEGRLTVSLILATIRDDPATWGILHDLNFSIVMRKLNAFRQSKPLGPAMPATAAVARDLELQVQSVLLQEKWQQAQDAVLEAHELALAAAESDEVIAPAPVPVPVSGTVTATTYPAAAAYPAAYAGAAAPPPASVPAAAAVAATSTSTAAAPAPTPTPAPEPSASAEVFLDASAPPEAAPSTLEHEPAFDVDFSFALDHRRSEPELDPRFAHLYNVDLSLLGVRSNASAYL